MTWLRSRSTTWSSARGRRGWRSSTRWSPRTGRRGAARRPAAPARRPLARRLPLRPAAPAVGDLRRDLPPARRRAHRRGRSERRLLRAGHGRGDRRLLRQGPRGGAAAVGRVRFLGMVEHRRRGRRPSTRSCSLLTGEETTVRVRRRVVDATYTESSIPSRHTPELHDRRGRGRRAAERPRPPRRRRRRATRSSAAARRPWTPAAGCSTIGVDPDRIRWVRSRDGWFFNRAFTQPLDQVGSFMQLQARWVGGRRRRRATPRTSPTGSRPTRCSSGSTPTWSRQAFRGATVSAAEVEALRIDRGRRAPRAGPPRRRRPHHLRRRRAADRRRTTSTSTAPPPACGRPTPRPVFEPGRITLQYVTLGFVPWGAATIGAVEALKDDDETKNRLCPPVDLLRARRRHPPVRPRRHAGPRRPRRRPRDRAPGPRPAASTPAAAPPPTSTTHASPTPSPSWATTSSPPSRTSSASRRRLGVARA